jgi:hypothetical protein
VNAKLVVWARLIAHSCQDVVGDLENGFVVRGIIQLHLMGFSVATYPLSKSATEALIAVAQQMNALERNIRIQQGSNWSRLASRPAWLSDSANNISEDFSTQGLAHRPEIMVSNPGSQHSSVFHFTTSVVELTTLASISLLT